MATDRPLTHDELRKRRPVKAVGQAPLRSIRHSFYVSSAGRDAPEISTSIEEVSSTGGRRVYRVDIGPAVLGEMLAHPPTHSPKNPKLKHFSKTQPHTPTQPPPPPLHPTQPFPAPPPP